MADIISEAEFEAEARQFLDGHAKRRVEEEQGWGEGSDRTGLFAEKTREQELAELEEARGWRRTLWWSRPRVED